MYLTYRPALLKWHMYMMIALAGRAFGALGSDPLENLGRVDHDRGRLFGRALHFPNIETHPRIPHVDLRNVHAFQRRDAHR